MAGKARRQPGTRPAAGAAHGALPRRHRSGIGQAPQQLPGRGVLPDVRHRRPAPHPDARLHHAFGGRNPGVGVLDPVLHPPDLPDHSGAGGAGQVRHLYLAGGQRFFFAADLDLVLGQCRQGQSPAQHRRHQRRRRGAAGRDRDRRRRAGAGHAGDRRPALRDLGPGGGRRPGGGPVHRRRPAAGDLECAVARRLLQDGRPRRLDPEAGDDLQAPAAGGGLHRGLCRLAETGRHPVAGRRGVFSRWFYSLSGAGAGRVLEARQPYGSDHRHGGRLPGLPVVHAARQPDPGRQPGPVMARHPAARRRRVRGACRAAGDSAGEPGKQPAEPRQPGHGRLHPRAGRRGLRRARYKAYAGCMTSAWEGVLPWIGLLLLRCRAQPATQNTT
ncbi:hypothetical protein MASSI9I_70191 [Massilia sp. 9I]|nr:hypothetical protein MASSI9I_70191 [Massilia sp. 9I]